MTHLEQDRLIAELTASRAALRRGDPAGLLEIVRRHAGRSDVDCVVLGWLPEQASDIYDLLVGSDTVLRVEVPRTPSAGAVTTSAQSVDAFRAQRPPLAKAVRRKLELALQLARGADRDVDGAGD